MRLGDITADQAVPTLAWVDGLGALEELELDKIEVVDRDPGPLGRLGPLRRARLVGRFGAGEAEVRATVRAEANERGVRRVVRPRARP